MNFSFFLTAAVLLQTRPAHFLKTLARDTVSTNTYLRREGKASYTDGSSPALSRESFRSRAFLQCQH